MNTLSSWRLLATCYVAVCVAACGGAREAPLTAGVPLHLEDHLDVATIEGSNLPATIPEPVEWRFDGPQPEWGVARPTDPATRPVNTVRTADALRVTLPDGRRNARGLIVGAIYVDLPDWRREEWAHVLVRARTEGVREIGLGLNLPQRGIPPGAQLQTVFQMNGGATPVVSDGSVQTYQIRPAWRQGEGTGPWQRLGLWFAAPEPAAIDILSVTVVPIAGLYTTDRVGRESTSIGDVHRRALFTHAPGRVAYRVRVPENGRLDTALGVLATNVPVGFRISARPDRGEAATLLDETYADAGRWASRSVDLSRFAGQTVTLGLETSTMTPGTVAFWGSPTVSGSRATDKPNVIFYVIDGGGADYMSVYGYNRRTTPNLERLAAEGALFEHVYSNASETDDSTPSFMTGLHDSVNGSDNDRSVSPQAITMAERFHAAGYQTAVFTSNSGNALFENGLERGVDFAPPFDGDDATSSVTLHDQFWQWRAGSPAEPYWVHFQTTDVHARLPTVPPFTGLFVGPAELQTYFDWQERLRIASRTDATGRYRGLGRVFSDDFEKAGISRSAFFSIREGLFAEAMAHNDYQLGRLVERLKAEGEWDHTLLIVAADHGIGAAQADLSLGLLEALPPMWGESAAGRAGPMLRPSITRVPLIVVWPGHIAGGQRFEPPVSMIDVLPTVLELTGLPMPEVMQGQSLVPLLRGEPGWRPRPVILEEFHLHPASGQPHGRLEVVDGRWGASMWIGPPPRPDFEPRPVPVLVYDLWTDPIAVAPINEQRPDLVRKYTAFLEDTWKDHQALAARLKPGRPVTLTPEQLERLRALGYIR